MDKNSLVARDAAVIAKIQTLRFNPLAATGGAGSYLQDEDGRRILDLSASATAASLGYGHPAVVEAMVKAASDMAGASLLMIPNEAATALAEQLLAVTPGRGERKVWYGHSGSDANDAAMRVASAATGRGRFISFIGSYHGCLAGSMSISGHTAMTHSLPRPGLVLLPYPNAYRPNFSPAEVLAMLDYQFETTCPPDQVAAVFIEPILSDGGLIVPPEGFLLALQERCQRHGILVVLDEVKVGLGRSGKLHAYQHDGLEPDMIVFGKGLGGGLPLSAMIGPAAILDHAAAFAMQTTAGNPVCTAVGGAVLETIIKENLAARADDMGNKMRAGFTKLAERHEMIGDVRGRGLAIGVDLVTSRETRAPVSATTTAKVIYRAYELGANFIYVGLDANVLEITPPLTVSEAEIEEGLDIIDRALGDVANGVVSDESVQAFMNW
ncbi:MAG: aspartate aminotransferase family protein [Proteobacteria bacterium]|nr:aspartate aminotransferase family protein [Pseudomonadota bacterium]MDA1355806.1 aspartate aminotransferase family protein [Pseudomonadota bacterium]